VINWVGSRGDNRVGQLEFGFGRVRYGKFDQKFLSSHELGLGRPSPFRVGFQIEHYWFSGQVRLGFGFL
jgi:hypothetical protein